MRRLFPLLILAFLPACAMVPGRAGEFGDPGEGDAGVTPLEIAERVIDAGDIRRFIGFLASDGMLGRATPGPELDRAASWIAEQFAAAGLEPAGQDGGFIQFWPLEQDGGASTPAQVPNVVGVLAGADGARASEYVILVAHFDHLGVGEPTEEGDSIYNGADDNASGTAALLELAEAFAALPARPDRPVLFLATSGQEKGALGARSFATSPTVFLADAVAALNMDMVGRNSPDSVGLVGHGYSSVGPLVVRTARQTDRLGLAVDTDPAPEEDLFTSSDHFPFVRAGIPAVTITSGLHEDHHRPGDEPSRIDADKAARIARLVFLVAYELATGTDVTWTEEGRRAIQ